MEVEGVQAFPPAFFLLCSELMLWSDDLMKNEAAEWEWKIIDIHF